MMNQNIDFIPFAKPFLGREEEEAALKVLRSGWLTTGPETKAFEKEFSSFTGMKHSIAVNSATSGLHLCMEALNIQKDDLVATSPYSFTSSSEIIHYLGAKPCFVDIDEDTYNINTGLLEKTVKENKISAILPVHIGGLPCDMKHINQISKKNNIPVVEDAAHAFPVKTGNGYPGSDSDAGVFSFYANKTITTGEGGMITTNRDDIAGRMRIMGFHGIDRECWNRYTDKKASWKYEVVEAGYKYNMPDIASAVGRCQLKKAVNFLNMRRKIADAYIKGFSGIDFLKLPFVSEEHAWHLFIIRIIEEKLTINRNEFINRINEKGIGTSVHFIPLHIMGFYRKKYGFKKEDFPVSYNNYIRSISLPIYPGLSEEQTDYIIKSIISIGKNNYK
jgi:dTDP-4-amino-4,6-dideoxygalactose transaminase